MDNNTVYFVAMAAAVVVGLVLTVVYYFARYYVRMGEGDAELAPTLKPKSESTSQVKSQAKSEAKPIELREALKKTREGFWGRFSGRQSLSEEDVDQVEEILFTSDLGPQTAQKIFGRISSELDGELTVDRLKEILKRELLGVLGRAETLGLPESGQGPMVWMVVGVNGVGKTTTIGKLAAQGKAKGLKVLVVAGDTFRAAADEQLKVWAERSGCDIFSQNETQDPAAVAYAGLEKARAESYDWVIVDTAGRLHTQDHLMEQLKKVKRVMGKVIEQSPHEVLLVLDANSGQNAMVQARSFHEALGLSGVALTKMDGTSKGGVAFGLAGELGLSIRFIGVGEAIEDLRPFEPQGFVDSIL